MRRTPIHTGVNPGDCHCENGDEDSGDYVDKIVPTGGEGRQNDEQSQQSNRDPDRPESPKGCGAKNGPDDMEGWEADEADRLPVKEVRAGKAKFAKHVPTDGLIERWDQVIVVPGSDGRD